MKSVVFLLVFVAVLTGCASPAAPMPTPVVQIQTVVVTQLVPAPTLAPLSTYTPYPTYTPAPPVVVTATPIPPTPTPPDTPTPRYTATPRPTLAPTKPPTATQPPAPPTATPNVAQTTEAKTRARLTASRGDGFYLVNVDIAPGVWRSQGTGSSCYWERTSKTGDIIDNHFGLAGGTMFVDAGDFQVHLKGCGTWVYIGQ